MADATRMYLHEDILLLALTEERGKVEAGAWYKQAVAAAVLAELMLGERIELQSADKEPKVRMRSTLPIGDELIDDWLSTIAAESQPRALSHWASKISNSKDLKDRVDRRLAERGVLRVQEDKFLFLFTRTSYPERDPGPERELRARLHQAVTGAAHDLDPRTVAVLSIAKATGLLRTFLDKRELEQHAKRIESIIEGEATGKAARTLIEQIEAVVTMIIIT